MADLTDQLAELLRRGGPVMLPLLAMSIISLGLVIERAWYWFGMHRIARQRWITSLTEALQAGERRAVARLVEGDRSPQAEVVRHLLEHGASPAVGLDAVERVRPRIERFMTTLSTIVTAAPLLGILGTVVGIIQSFELLSDEAKALDPPAVAGGIAVALLTTAVGLVIALGTLFPYMVFRGQVGRALGRLESIILAAEEGLGGGGRVSPSSASEDGSPPATPKTSNERTPVETAG